MGRIRQKGITRFKNMIRDMNKKQFSYMCYGKPPRMNIIMVIVHPPVLPRLLTILRDSPVLLRLQHKEMRLWAIEDLLNIKIQNIVI
ncbi:MAG: hypothetical protein EZS28_015214 [Streblomastix strix]|uniref:Uncharacterized protein n=1 Tax=Streblomastix strix TaxID=222440 RepID=A0A5J4W459_9EUKA|nr:MAG: hypothetical protein EZS28_015214 [Streblomastix strix]